MKHWSIAGKRTQKKNAMAAAGFEPAITLFERSTIGRHHKTVYQQIIRIER
jgi:hypothetical protein